MDAEVTLKFVIPDVCSREELIDEFFSFEDHVTELIDHEGFYTFLDSIESVYKIEEIKQLG